MAAVLRVATPPRRVIVLTHPGQLELVNEILARLKYYAPNLDKIGIVVDIKESLSLKNRLSITPLLSLLGPGAIPFCLQKLVGGIFYVNFEENGVDGWQWHEFLTYLKGPAGTELALSKDRLTSFVSRIKHEQHDKCYIFGTGSSLDKAINRSWNDGYRVVCNTIVRDPELWQHVNPHFIVAGDAIYHFGHTEFARAFRKDLQARLQESDTMFVYPAIFHAFVERELSEVKDRLIPIGQGRNQSFNIDLLQVFELPALGNVLGLLLLPIACTLSKKIFMIGFDGRAPDDKLFWSNSKKHSYPELMHSLQEAHPKFFEQFMPKPGTDSYVKKYHGDLMDTLMTNAEREGWIFVMMHRSWTETFQKRYVEGLL